MVSKYEPAGETLEEKQARLVRQRIVDSNAPLLTRDKYALDKFMVNEGNQKAYDSVLKLLEGQARHYLLTLVGDVGRGKTHLAIGALWKGLDNGLVARYWQCEALLDDLRDGYQNSNYRVVMNRVQKSDLLILDDIGAEKVTEWTGAKMDQIIDYRYEGGLRTIVTTNLKVQQLAPRIASRLKEGVVVALTCGDYRTIIGKRGIRHDEAVKSKS